MNISSHTAANTGCSACELVYVSCDPATLARDCIRMVEGGFTIRSIQPFDLFPQTFHMESIVILVKPG